MALSFIFAILLARSLFGLAFQLSIPSATIEQGTTVNVTWQRGIGDPPSFGIMQRDLQDGIVKNVTSVANPAEALSGAVPVTFNFSGSILLAGIAELSLEPGQSFDQLEPGTQVTVQALAGKIEVSASPATSSQTPNSTVVTVTTTSTETTTSIFRHRSSTVQVPSLTTPQSSQYSSSQSQSNSSISISNTVFSPTIASTQSTASTDPGTAMPQSTTSQPAPTSSSPPTTASPASSKQGLMVGLSVAGCVLLCLFILCLFLRYQRSVTRRRVWTFRWKLFGENQISPFDINSFDHSNDLESRTVAYSFAQQRSPFSSFGAVAEGLALPRPSYRQRETFSPDFHPSSFRNSDSINQLTVTPVSPPRENGSESTRTSRDPAAEGGSDSKERYALALALEDIRAANPVEGARDSWSVIMEQEPLPKYIESDRST